MYVCTGTCGSWCIQVGRLAVAEWRLARGAEATESTEPSSPRKTGPGTTAPASGVPSGVTAFLQWHGLGAAPRTPAPRVGHGGAAG